MSSSKQRASYKSKYVAVTASELKQKEKAQVDAILAASSPEKDEQKQSSVVSKVFGIFGGAKSKALSAEEIAAKVASGQVVPTDALDPSRPPPIISPEQVGLQVDAGIAGAQTSPVVSAANTSFQQASAQFTAPAPAPVPSFVPSSTPAPAPPAQTAGYTPTPSHGLPRPQANSQSQASVIAPQVPAPQPAPQPALAQPAWTEQSVKDYLNIPQEAYFMQYPNNQVPGQFIYGYQTQSNFYQLTDDQAYTVLNIRNQIPSVSPATVTQQQPSYSAANAQTTGEDDEMGEIFLDQTTNTYYIEDKQGQRTYLDDAIIQQLLAQQG
jgi:hypothetical protein